MVAFEHHGQPLWLENLINTGSNARYFLTITSSTIIIPLPILTTYCFTEFSVSWLCLLLKQL